MISTHDYAASVDGTPLGIRGGRITVDGGSAPHVTGQLTITMPTDPDILAALDPRTAPRVTIHVDADFPSGPQTRTFDLGVRDWDGDFDDRASVLTLPLASDEALLDDYAPLSTDTTPYTYQNSIRALVDYVLDQAIPGASLAAGGPDAPIRALISSVNIVRNPRAKADLTDWSSGNTMTRSAAGGPAGCPTYVNALSGSAGQVLVAVSEAGVPLQAGKRYRVSVWQNAVSGTPLSFDGIVYSAANVALLDLSNDSHIATGGWVRRWIDFTAPEGATKLRLRAFTTGSVPAVTSLNTTGWRVSEVTADPTDTGYYDGDTTDTTEYVYAYSGSTSTRAALIERAPDILTWRVGVSGLEFLAPILQALGLRIVCDETRTWTLRTESYRTDGAIAVRYGVNMVAGSERISRDAELWFDARVTRYRWIDQNGIQQERTDAYALNDPYTRLTTVDVAAPYPGPGRSEYAVRRAQQRGREVTVRKVAAWTEHAEQPTSVRLPNRPMQIGIAQTVVFDLDRREVEITTRTVDTPDGAVNLLDSTVNALTGTVNDL
jgi:hypothetical protein